MSDDLISRKALFEEINSYHYDTVNQEIRRIEHIAKAHICEIIDMQPTAYDVENVIKQLQAELNLTDKEKERCARENPLQFDVTKGYAQGISVALEIVKSGGVAND